MDGVSSQDRCAGCGRSADRRRGDRSLRQATARRGCGEGWRTYALATWRSVGLGGYRWTHLASGSALRLEHAVAVVVQDGGVQVVEHDECLHALWPDRGIVPGPHQLAVGVVFDELLAHAAVLRGPVGGHDVSVLEDLELAGLVDGDHLSAGRAAAADHAALATRREPEQLAAVTVGRVV